MANATWHHCLRWITKRLWPPSWVASLTLLLPCSEWSLCHVVNCSLVRPTWSGIKVFIQHLGETRGLQTATWESLEADSLPGQPEMTVASADTWLQLKDRCWGRGTQISYTWFPANGNCETVNAVLSCQTLGWVVMQHLITNVVVMTVTPQMLKNTTC